MLYNKHNTWLLISLYKLFIYIYIYNTLWCCFCYFTVFQTQSLFHLLTEEWPGHSSRIPLLCSAEASLTDSERHEGNKVNDDRIFIFGWTVPLRVKCEQHEHFSKASTVLSTETLKIHLVWAIVLCQYLPLWLLMQKCVMLYVRLILKSITHRALCVPVHLVREGEKWVNI